MNRLMPFSLALLLFAGCASLKTASQHTGPWNMAVLKQAPAAEWGVRTGLGQVVYYQGEPYRGKPTLDGSASRALVGVATSPALSPVSMIA
jgi:hypothetical protein